MYSNYMKPTFMTNSSNTSFGSNNGNSPFSKGPIFGKTNSPGFAPAPSTSTFGQPATSTPMFPSMQPSNIFQAPNTSTFNAGPSTQPTFAEFGEPFPVQSPAPCNAGILFPNTPPLVTLLFPSSKQPKSPDTSCGKGGGHVSRRDMPRGKPKGIDPSAVPPWSATDSSRLVVGRKRTREPDSSAVNTKRSASVLSLRAVSPPIGPSRTPQDPIGTPRRPGYRSPSPQRYEFLPSAVNVPVSKQALASACCYSLPSTPVSSVTMIASESQPAFEPARRDNTAGALQRRAMSAPYYFPADTKSHSPAVTESQSTTGSQSRVAVWLPSLLRRWSKENPPSKAVKPAEHFNWSTLVTMGPDTSAPPLPIPTPTASASTQSLIPVHVPGTVTLRGTSSVMSTASIPSVAAPSSIHMLNPNVTSPITCPVTAQTCEFPPKPVRYYRPPYIAPTLRDKMQQKITSKEALELDLIDAIYESARQGSSIFGQQQQASTSGLFGNSNAFGQNKTGYRFGATTNQSGGLFGQQPQQPTSSSLFQPNTSNLFGGSTNAFGNQGQSGTVVKFSPVTGTDTMQKNGVATSISTKHHCITCMKEYESKSLEELRFEDYSSNRKGPQQQTGFAATPFGAPAPNTSTSLFGQTDNKQAFGQTTGFGQTSTFGQTSSSFGLANQNSAPSLFGKPTGFGAPTSNTNTFGFNPTASTSNPFNTSQAPKPFSQPLFGNTSTQPTQTTAFGNNVFGQTNTQNSATNLFQKPAQSTTGFNTGQSGFTFNQPTTTQYSSLFQAPKPSTGFGMFVQPNTATSAFGQTTQSGFGSNFGKPTTSAFGQQQTTGFGTSFSGSLQQAPLFSGPAQAKPPSLFGNTTTGGNLFTTNAFQQPTSFSLQPNVQQQAQFPPEPPDDQKNMLLLLSQPYADGPHLYGLEPILSESSNNTTNPQDIKALLDVSRKREEQSRARAKLKVQPPKPKRNNPVIKEFFETNPPLMRSSRKCLVIRKFNEAPTTIFNKYKNELLEEAEMVLKAQAAQCPDSDVSSILPDSSTNNTPRSEHVERLPERDAAMKKVALRLQFDSKTSEDLDITEDNVHKTLPVLDDTLSFPPMVSNKASGFSLVTEDDSIVNESDVETSNLSTADAEVHDNAAGVILTRPEYYIHPPLKDLGQFMDEDGNCVVQGLTIGRRGYGNVHFSEPINIAGMNFDDLIHFRHREIIVYPDDNKKPTIGEGLNRPAQVTLDKVFPREKGTTTYITDVSQIIQSDFIDNLMLVTQKHKCKFVEYRPRTGSWVFKVKHFSKYTFSESDDEQCEINSHDPAGALKKKEVAPLKSAEKKLTEQPKVGLGGLRPLKTVLSTTVEQQGEEDEAIATFWQGEDFYHEDGAQPKGHLQPVKSLFVGLESSTPIEKPATQDKPLIILPRNKAIVVTPNIYSLSALDNIRSRDFAFLRRCYTDLGLFKGDAYKAGWFRACKYFASGLVPFDVTNSHVLNLTSLKTSNKRYDVMMPNLIDALSNTLKESDFAFDKYEVPTLTIKKGCAYLRKQANLFNQHARTHRLVNKDRYLSAVWNLCLALWDDDIRECEYTRRQRLSNWLQEFSYDLCDDRITDTTQTKSQVLDSIFQLLTFHKVQEAAKLAMKNNLNRLGLLISQLSNNERCKAILKKYITLYPWQTDIVPEQFKKIYLLLSGIPVDETINICDKLDWRQCLGVHLWYISALATPIDVSVALYKSAFMEDRYACKPIPPYCISETEAPDYDLLYHILSLYTNGAYQLADVLHPATHTENLMDYRFSWILMQLFLSLEVGLIREGQQTSLHTTFSNQLEEMGQWKWSIFVLLFLKDNTLKKNLIMKLLERNLTPYTTTQIENELVNLFKIPPTWIHEVKAHMVTLVGTPYEIFQHFLYVKDWKQANNVLVTHILPELFINDHYSHLDRFINRLEVGSRSLVNWNVGAGLIKDFMQMQHVIMDVMDQDESDLKYLTPFSSVCRRINCFPVENELQKLCIAELSKKCALMFKVLYKNLEREAYLAKAVDLLEQLVMPSDYMHHEIFYFIGFLACNVK